MAVLAATCVEISSSACARARTDCSQMVVALGEGWSSVRAELCRLEKTGPTWHVVGPCRRAVVGESGLGWVIGQRPSGRAEPIKHEGDGRTPAGVFPLRQLVGYAAQPPAGATLPYTQATSTLHCVDDADSPYYNQIVDAASMKSLPWSSSELMRRPDDLYEALAVVDYNKNPVTKGAGSCIFVHTWRTPTEGTAGCVALAANDVLELLAWLKPAASPMIAILPAAEYRVLRTTWSLPDMP